MKYRITYEHGDRYSRRTDTITVEAENEQDAERQVPYDSSDDFSFVKEIKPVTSKGEKVGLDTYRNAAERTATLGYLRGNGSHSILTGYVIGGAHSKQSDLNWAKDMR